jgi:site-specific recombinase XerD
MLNDPSPPRARLAPPVGGGGARVAATPRDVAMVLSPAVLERLDAYARAADGALAANTVRALRSDLAVWQAWCAVRGLAPVPAAAGTVAAFVDDRGAERAPATVRRYVASVATLHRAAELPDPTKAPAARFALKRLARAKGTRARQAAPLDQLAVERIIARTGDALIDRRDVALLLVARDLLGRRSEVCALRAGDVQRAADGSGTVLIARSKTDQEGQGSVGYLAPRTMAAVDAWLATSGLTDGPLFRGVHRTGRLGRPLEPGEVARVFKKLARRAGLDPAAVSGHSCRVGMAQDLVAFGADLPAVMQAGRWETPAMPARYAERLFAARNAVAQYHARRPSG